MTYDGTTALAANFNDPSYFMYAMKYFGYGVDRDAGCSVNRTNFYKAGATAANNSGAFALCFSLEGMNSEHDEYRSCTSLVGNIMELNFENSIAGAAGSILYVDAFIMYEYDIYINQGGCVAINKINVFSNNFNVMK